MAALISFEGGEGVGKSTQIHLLAARLIDAGYDVCSLREPGGTIIGEKVRTLLLDAENTHMTDLTELLLYEAARSQLVEEVIKPALEQGKVVLVDRFTDSTLAYQAFARGLDRNLVDKANLIGSDGLVPARTILLEQDVTEGLAKATSKGADRLDSEGLAFHQKVHDGFEQLSREYPERIVTITCKQHKEETHELVFAAVADLFPNAAAKPYTITEELIQDIRGKR